MEIRESKTRECLILDIKQFLIEAEDNYNNKNVVKRIEFLKLQTRICNLNDYNFENVLKYKQFLKYVSQPELQTKIYLAVTEYTKNPIRIGFFEDEEPHFHRILNYFNTLSDWLK